jgi:hypothetical protein
MARYTCLVKVANPEQNVVQSLGTTLESCNFDIIYETASYLVAREVPGGVAFPQLVTVEVLIDEKPEDKQTVQMNFVVKNEELPLQTNNHCRRMFDLVNRAVFENRSWELVEAIAS